MSSDKLERALTNEIGPPYLKHNPPSSRELYNVSTFVWVEWNRMQDQKKNIPFWNIVLKNQARKKIKNFMIALHVLHNYVPEKDEHED